LRRLHDHSGFFGKINPLTQIGAQFERRRAQFAAFAHRRETKLPFDRFALCADCAFDSRDERLARALIGDDLREIMRWILEDRFLI
jgi:hypothetical protein